MPTTHHNLELIGGPTVQQMWAIVDGNMQLIERGRSVRLSAGEALTARQLVWIDSADVQAHPATDADRPLIGFVVADADVDTDVFVQIDGVITDDQVTPAWVWTPGAPLYADNGVTPAPGTLTETAGSTPPVAIALSATVILILPSGLGG